MTTNSNLDAEIARRIAAKSKYAPPLPPTKEDLRERLVTIFRLVKAASEEEDGAASDALGDEAGAAEDALIALEVEGDDIYMPAAKLIIAKAGEIFEDIDDSIRDTRLNAEAALSALRLFGLVDLYRECFPRDGIGAATEKMALARSWVERSIAAGEDPKLCFEEREGQWYLHTSLVDNDQP
jgi:hypothetical protein